MAKKTINEIKEAITNSAGIISTIAKRLNCEWHTCKKYIDSYDETRRALNDEIEKNIDKAESIILKALNSEDIQTAKWYLQTIGKQRGYSEKQEIEHSGEIKADIEHIFKECYGKVRDQLETEQSGEDTNK